MARQKITNFCLTIYHWTRNHFWDAAPACPRK